MPKLNTYTLNTAVNAAFQMLGIIPGAGSTFQTVRVSPAALIAFIQEHSAAVDGREVEMQKSATHVQWRYVGDATWIDLIPLADITGPSGEQGPQGLPGAPAAWGDIAGTLSAQTDLQSALDGKVGTGDPRLTDAREWTAATVAQAEAEAGTATNRHAWTAQRVRQAIVAWWLTASTAFGRSLVTATDAAAGRTALRVREQILADRTYFVRTDGSDSNNGLSNTAGGAFLTIQKAVDVAATLDLGIFNCIIQVAGGTYTGAVVLKPFVGAGQIRIIGNETTPANVIITGGGNLISGTDFGRYLIAGVTIASTGTRNIQVSGRGQLQYRNIVSQGAAGLNTHILVTSGAEVQSLGNITLNGNSLVGFWGQSFGFINIRSQPITFAPGTTLSARGFHGSDQGRVDMIGVAFSGSFTGKRYEVSGLGAIFTNNAGESYIPGTIAGTTATGGIYY